MKRDKMSERYDSLDTNNRLIWNFRDIGHTMRHTFEGRGSQKRVLMLLRENPGITQRELTERLGIQPGSASEVIGKLEAAGLLLRTPSEADRRTANISLTEAGEEAAAAAHAQRQERHEKMFSCLTESEKEILLELLERINASWSQQYGGDRESGECSNYRKGRGCRCRK